MYILENFGLTPYKALLALIDAYPHLEILYAIN